MSSELRGDATDVNAVRLRGRVARSPERRALPSGDEVVGFRVVVRRQDSSTVDTIDVSLGPAPAAGRRPGTGQVGRRQLAAAAKLGPDQRVEVVGQLRRRWWAAGEGRRSRVEVQASAVVPVVTDPPVDG